jgi:hypothetical protein
MFSLTFHLIQFLALHNVDGKGEGSNIPPQPNFHAVNQALASTSVASTASIDALIHNANAPPCNCVFLSCDIDAASLCFCCAAIVFSL